MKSKYHQVQVITTIKEAIDELGLVMPDYNFTMPHSVTFDKGSPTYTIHLKKRSQEEIDAINERAEKAVSEVRLPVDPSFLLKGIDELDLSVRANNCLIYAGVTRIIDLVNITEEESRNIKNLGRRTHEEIMERLASYSLTIDMKIDEKNLKALIMKNRRGQQ